jgi:very-short-patch-repair endonuclease
MARESAKAEVDRRIAAVAGRQHGVITTRQVEAAGVHSSGISDRVHAGRLHRIHRGVYGVGHASLGNEGRWMAAVLASGNGAVLSHLSAAELWGIRPRVRRRSEAGGRGGSNAVHVTVPGTAGRKGHDGIVLHRSSTLTASDCTRHDRIPVTTPARTLSDLRPIISPAQFKAAVREAEFLRLPIGAGAWRRRCDSPLPPPTRTELEALFISLCRRRRLPQPEVNVRIDRFEVDFLWRPERLIVEVDGWESHRTRSAFEEDRVRDARLKVLGYEVLRVTWWQLETDGVSVARTIRVLLKRAGWRLSSEMPRKIAN